MKRGGSISEAADNLPTDGGSPSAKRSKSGPPPRRSERPPAQQKLSGAEERDYQLLEERSRFYRLADLPSHRADDPSELIRRRYLCRGGALLLCGPTGVGKSALALQLAVAWALGKPCFGLAPAKPLISLFIQAENDLVDLGEMRDGVFAGMSLTPVERDLAGNDVILLREDESTGTTFLAKVSDVLRQLRPDLLFIDPVLAYLGGDANSQRDVGAFLRNGLNPLLREFDIGCVVLHHTNKPPSGKQKPQWSAGDFAYLGSGSAEFPNWARAVLAVRSRGSRDVFELQAGKRGAHLNWRDASGARTFLKHIAHSENGVICWREVEPGEDESARAGRPSDYEAADLIPLLPKAGFTSTEWCDSAKKELGISQRRFYELKKRLGEGGLVSKSKEKKWTAS